MHEKRTYARTIPMPRRPLALVALLCALIFPPAWAAHSPEHGMDVVLVMDSSGSMKSTDPQGLRKPAAKMLISLLSEHDHASVVSFSDQGYPVSYLRPSKPSAEQEQLFHAVDKISSRGAYTNIHGALLAAKRVLDQNTTPAERRLVVLMSDGKMDLGDDAESARLTQQVFDEVLPLYKAANIELQTIAFSEASDKKLLAQLAKAADGQFYVANTDTELHQTFSHIFEDSAKPDMLPMDGGRFHIDEAIQEVTIIGSKDGEQVQLWLTAPDGEKYTAAQRPASISWLVSPAFDLITIKQPKKGDWHLGASNNHNKAYIITNLSLAMGVSNSKPMVGEEFQLQAWLEQDQQVLIREAILQHLNITADIRHPDDQVQTLQLVAANPTHQGDAAGIFYHVLKFDSEGPYTITLSADSGTFKRSRTLRLYARAPAPEPHTEQESHAKEEQAHPEEAPSKDEVAVKDEAAAEQEGEQGSNLLNIMLIFVSVNLVLGTIAGAVFFLHKRRQQRQGKKGTGIKGNTP